MGDDGARLAVRFLCSVREKKAPRSDWQRGAVSLRQLSLSAFLYGMMIGYFCEAIPLATTSK